MKIGSKKCRKGTHRLPSYIIGNTIDETNFRYKLLLTDRKVLRFRKTFANNSSANINSSKTQVSINNGITWISLHNYEI